MHEYTNLVDWKGLELSSNKKALIIITREKMQTVIQKKFERSQTVWAEWIELEKSLAKF